MANGRHYKYDDINSVLQRVIMAQSELGGRVTVYVPPVGGALPYTVEFDDMGEAEEFASRAQGETAFAGRALLLTRDKVEWWLSNLTPVE